MNAFNFNDQEKNIIKKAIATRRSNCKDEFYKKHLIALDKIEIELDFDITNLSPMNKSIVTGCLRETYIYPNEECFSLTDFQLMQRTEELSAKLENLDIVLNLLNKLLQKTQQKYLLFSGTLSKIDRILNSNKILFSTTTDGKVYKAGIIIGKNEGIHFELDNSSEPTIFLIGKLNPQSYISSGSPQEVKSLLSQFSENHELTLMQKSFAIILEKILN